MTIAELIVEAECRFVGDTYAGGMTAGDIEDIKAKSKALREKRAEPRGTETS